MRNWYVVIFLGLLIVISFLIWGEWFTELFGEGGINAILNDFGQWAWAIGILFLIADLFLPLPATIIMSGLGFIYGPFMGGVLATTGNFLSGLLAYGICRSLGRSGALKILGEQDLLKGEIIFNRNGGWIVAISRWLPIIPEIISCMAGLNQMKLKTFCIALACGSLPFGFTFAYIGYAGVEHPTTALAISAGLPFFLWIAAQYILRRLINKDV